MKTNILFSVAQIVCEFAAKCQKCARQNHPLAEVQGQEIMRMGKAEILDLAQICDFIAGSRRREENHRRGCGCRDRRDSS